MKLQDALNILSIDKAQVTYEDVKKAYRKACKKYHPDVNPAGLAIMKAVNEAYDTLRQERFPITVYGEKNFNDYGEILNQALNAIIHLAGITIEVCGSWVWVSGNTFPHKDELKQANFLWSRQKGMWYFRPESKKRKYCHAGSPIEEIRAKYGSEKINTHFRPALS